MRSEPTQPRKGEGVRGYGLRVMGNGEWGMGDGLRVMGNMKTKPNTMQKKGKTEIYDDILEKSA